MKSFHNNPKIKAKYLRRVNNHFKADQIVKGSYWENGKGCAVGCTIHSDQHKNYETELGVPEWLARLEDTIFEGLPNDLAKTWPGEFLKAIPIGKDLNSIRSEYVSFVLRSNYENFDVLKYSHIKDIIETCANLYDQGKLPEVHKEEFSAARSSARLAARLAAESAARSIAKSAAGLTTRSAWSAWSAAWSAAWSTAGSAAWAVMWSGAESAAYVKYADKLLEMLRNLK